MSTSGVPCTKCGRPVDRKQAGDAVPTISGGIMGDEYIESYHLCADCGVYSVEVVRDRFLGEEEVTVRGPISREEAEPLIELIRKCPEPWNKRCRCEAHRAYFRGWLD